MVINILIQIPLDNGASFVKKGGRSVEPATDSPPFHYPAKGPKTGFQMPLNFRH
jgi:hypothetical protein